MPKKRFRPERWAVLMGCALAGAGITGHARAEAAGSVTDLTQLSLEQLSQVEVTSVSKNAEPLSDAPAAVYVITRDDIMRWGAKKPAGNPPARTEFASGPDERGRLRDLGAGQPSIVILEGDHNFMPEKLMAHEVGTRIQMTPEAPSPRPAFTIITTTCAVSRSSGARHCRSYGPGAT